jgi:hypothetical protein
MCLRGSSMTLPPSLEQWPPTVTAAVWKALEDRSELAAKRSSVPSEEATRVSVVEMHYIPSTRLGLQLVVCLPASVAAVRRQQPLDVLSLCRTCVSAWPNAQGACICCASCEVCISLPELMPVCMLPLRSRRKPQRGQHWSSTTGCLLLSHGA